MFNIFTLKFFNRHNNLSIKKILFYLIILTNNILIDLSACLASVDHKNTRLISYLDQISDNQEEKAGIIDIIKHYRAGSYLDIGSGRDTISYIVDNLAGEDLAGEINLIAADLEGKTLTEIAKHHPALFFNFNKTSNINLSLVKMDATEMHPLKDSSVKAINASALVHEINSYVPHKTSVDRFFGEAIRVLEKEGFLIYRDPTLQTNPQAINSLIIKNNLAKKFTVLFLPKFLDNKLTTLVDMHGSSLKPEFNYHSRFQITLSLIDQASPVTLNYQEFFALPASRIDFSKNVKVIAPRRLLSEIQRHYILFVKNVYPLAFIPHFEQSIAADLPSEIKKTINQHISSKGIKSLSNLSKQEKALLNEEVNKLSTIVQNGVSIKNLEKTKIESIEKLLKLHNVSKDLYKISDSGFWFDAKLFAIIFNRLQEELKSPDLPLESLIWLAREGEEYYFYFTAEELIGYLQKFCAFYLKGTSKEGYVLAPLSAKHIRYAKRDSYKHLLERDMVQLDAANQKQEFVTSKTIITFKLGKHSLKPDYKQASRSSFASK